MPSSASSHSGEEGEDQLEHPNPSEEVALPSSALVTNGNGTVLSNGGGATPEDEHSNSSTPVEEERENYVTYKCEEVFSLPVLKNEAGLPVDLASLPFECIPGEGVANLGETKSGGIIVLTNFRLHVTDPNGAVAANVPLGLIETIELRDLFSIQINCRDATTYRILLRDNEQGDLWNNLIGRAIVPQDGDRIFANAHFAWASKEKYQELGSFEAFEPYSFEREVERMKFDLATPTWRISHINNEHGLCPTYPQQILVPHTIDEDKLREISKFRSSKRIPAIVFRHHKTGAVLARCSQPEVGIFSWRCEEDEKFLQSMAESCCYDYGSMPSSQRSTPEGAAAAANGGAAGEDVGDGQESVDTSGSVNGEDLTSEANRMGGVKKLLLVDCRSYAAAMGNRARGGGVEHQDYYPNAEIVFMNLPNIHTVRSSFAQVRKLLSTVPSDKNTSVFLSTLEKSQWLHYIDSLFKVAILCSGALDKESRPVLVHCSDGWDRTPQVTALTQLLLDPYYRTLEGFRILVEKEFLEFGHKMADRNGGPFQDPSTDERCPVFLQFLDCVHQLTMQFPLSFEFNMNYLVKLARHTSTNLFGTFLCNNVKERKERGIYGSTRCIWRYLHHFRDKFRNEIYSRDPGVLTPRGDVRNFRLWLEVYNADVQPVDLTGFNVIKPPKGSKDNSAESSDSEQQSDDPTTAEGDTTAQPGNQPNPTSPPVDEDRRPPSPSSSNSHKPTTNGVVDGLSRTKQNGDSIAAAAAVVHHSSKQQSPSSSSSLQYVQSSSTSARSSPQGRPPSVDSDGLMTHHDPVQECIAEMKAKQSRTIADLKTEISRLRRLLVTGGAAASVNGGGGHPLSPQLRNGGGGGGGEEPERQQNGSTTSEGSSTYEIVDENDGDPTRWVPDHALRQCMRCNSNFWFGRRKHHCRSCGGLFCADCSNQFVPVPSEQLYHPVRTCRQCYEKAAPNEEENDDEEEESKEAVE